MNKQRSNRGQLTEMLTNERLNLQK